VDPAIERVLLFAGMIFGLVSIPFGLPGPLIIFGSILLYGIATHFNAGIGVPFILASAVLTLLEEIADHWLGAVGARRFGASRTSVWLSFVGGVVGAILVGGPLAIFFGPLGPVAGGFAGAFVLVVGYELYLRRNIGHALTVGWGTLLGRLAGIVLQVVISVAMIVAVAAVMLF
jgi:uncharacterized protein YqgC (DUF456 family)